MHLIEGEFRSRWERGVAEKSIKRESQILAKWLKQNHPDMPTAGPKAIENHLRDEHRMRLAKPRK